MKTYTVHFGASLEEYGTVEVEAESFEEAARLAWEQEHSSEGPHCELEVDWSSMGDMRVVGIEDREKEEWGDRWFDGDPVEEEA